MACQKPMLTELGIQRRLESFVLFVKLLQIFFQCILRLIQPGTTSRISLQCIFTDSHWRRGGATVAASVGVHSWSRGRCHGLHTGMKFKLISLDNLKYHHGWKKEGTPLLAKISNPPLLNGLDTLLCPWPRFLK